jgi:hypothetical protein
MKRLIVLFLLILLPFVSAVEINMKSELSQGETILAKFSGTFQDKISKEDVFFYREHTRVPIEFDIMNIGNDYYIYAVNDKSPGNYSISIEDVYYYKEGKLVNDKITKNFTITDDVADFSINPGFIKTTNDFEVQLQSLQDKDITVKINSEKISESQNNETDKSFLDSLFGNLFLSLTGKSTLNINEQKSITLSPNEIKSIEFKMQDTPEPTVKEISFSSGKYFYEFILYIPSAVKVSHKTSLNFEPSELKISLANATSEQIVTLENVGDELLKNVSVYVSSNLKDYVNVSKDIIYNLGVNQSAEIYLLFSRPNMTVNITGELTAKIPNETEDMVIIFETVKNASDVIVSSASKDCAELNGTIFEEPQICDGEERFAKDGNCCIGQVTEPQKSNTGFIIGWLIIIILLAVLVWFFKFKYKKAKNEINLFKIAKGR